jgi:hypothetical protein
VALVLISYGLLVRGEREEEVRVGKGTGVTVGEEEGLRGRVSERGD